MGDQPARSFNTNAEEIAKGAKFNKGQSPDAFAVLAIALLFNHFRIPGALHGNF